MKTILTNDKYGNENNFETKKLFNWLTSNNQILLFMDIGHELNRHLYGEESCKHLNLDAIFQIFYLYLFSILDTSNWDLDENLTKATKQSVLKCFNLLENMFSISSSFTYLASKCVRFLLCFSSLF